MSKILIVEDDEMILKAYTTILGEEGYTVLTATDGQQALKIANKEKPQLILLDMLMPVMDGETFLKEFDAKNKPETKIVILSNSASPDTLKAALDLGAIEYLIKTDVKPDEVKTLVAGLLASN